MKMFFFIFNICWVPVPSVGGIYTLMKHFTKICRCNASPCTGDVSGGSSGTGQGIRRMSLHHQVTSLGFLLQDFLGRIKDEQEATME